MGEITQISDRKRRRHDTLTRINDQLDHVRNTINKLVQDVDITELTSYERLNTAIKFMSQYSRLIMLRQTCDLDETESASALMIEAFQRQLRGEVVAEPVVEENQDGPND